MPDKPKSSKTAILGKAEIMPQHPGGLNALLAYLKRNLNAPDNVEEGKEISVKVKFVVNFSGKLESFKVIEPGGEVFDNEVLRVCIRCNCGFPARIMEKLFQSIILSR